MEIPAHDDIFWKRKTIKEKFYLTWQVIWGLPKSFGSKGFKLPILCSYHVMISKLKGAVIIDSPYHLGMIKLGFTAPETYDNHRLSFVWVNDGIVTFAGNAGMRNGVSIRNYGYLTFGNNFHISSPSTIICYKAITFGEDVLIGWNCEFTDGDAHKIYKVSDQSRSRTNHDQEIVIGNHVWIAANVKILKGTKIGDNVIIAASSIITKPITGENQIIGGYPARVIKEGVNWYV